MVFGEYMKKIKIIGLLLIIMLFVSGCDFSKKNLENAQIYTTVYPITYITNYLYGNDSNITSIYPVGVDIDNYKLTEFFIWISRWIYIVL